MNYKAIAHTLGLVLKLEALLMIPPLLISIYCGAYPAARAFVTTMAAMLLIALVINAWEHGKKAIYARESFLAVAVCWICLSLFGALPFWLSGEIPRLEDALFESISGFTTTGATILTNVEGLSKGLLFWRSAAHWMGGMGVLVLLMAVMSGEGGINVLRAESSGPSPGKLVPKLRQSSLILYGIYIGMTLLMIPLLLAGGMPLYDSVVNALATAGTGGFAVTNDSIAAYGSLYLELVIAVFMLLFGVNFNIYYFLLVRNWRAVWKHSELRAYGLIVAISTLLIAWNLTGAGAAFGEALRLAFFHVGSVITTTGFSTADYSVWPLLSKIILLFLTFSGACSGSTGGGFKLSRIVILAKEVRRALFRMSRPRAVDIVRMDGKAVDPHVVHGVGAYFVTYTALFVLSLLAVSLDGFDFETTFTASLTCLSNVGPGFGMVSPAGNFSEFSTGSKLVFSLSMLMGRLEIYPMLLLFAPRTWRRV